MNPNKCKIHKLIFLLSLFLCLNPYWSHAQNQYGQPSNNMQSPNNNNGFPQNNGLGNNSFGNSNNQSQGSNGNEMSSRRQKQRSSQRTSRRETSSNPNSSESSSPRRTKSPRQASSEGTAPRVDSSASSSSMMIFQSKNGQAYTGKAQDIPKPHVPTINTLFLDSKKTTVVKDEPFVVEVKLNIGKETVIDSLTFVLSYETDLLLPVQGKSNTGEWIPANTVTTKTPNGDDKNYLLTRHADRFTVDENRIDTAEGRIAFSVSAPQTSLRNNGTVAQITFVPLQISDRTSIEFLFDAKDHTEEIGYQTGLLLQKEDLLGTKGNPADGVVPLHLQITDTAPTAKSMEESAIAKKEDRTDEQVKLSLVSEQLIVEVGDTFDVYVQLDNPDHSALDSVSLLILYNPRVLQVIDSDPSSSGININDQANFAQFPFDFPIQNRVDTDKGMIDYRKKGFKTNIRGSGNLATIQFRALQPTSKTEFRILIHETGQFPTTGVCYKNHDILGSSQDITDGITSTFVSIRATTAHLNQIKARQNAG